MDGPKKGSVFAFDKDFENFLVESSIYLKFYIENYLYNIVRFMMYVFPFLNSFTQTTGFPHYRRTSL